MGVPWEWNVDMARVGRTIAAAGGEKKVVARGWEQVDAEVQLPGRGEGGGGILVGSGRRGGLAD